MGEAEARDDDEDEVAGLFGDFEEEDRQDQEREQQQPDQGREGADASGSHEPAHDEGGDPEEVPPPPNIHLPIAPSQEDWDEHFRTHINFRDWCPVCVEARG